MQSGRVDRERGSTSKLESLRATTWNKANVIRLAQWVPQRGSLSSARERRVSEYKEIYGEEKVQSECLQKARSKTMKTSASVEFF